MAPKAKPKAKGKAGAKSAAKATAKGKAKAASSPAAAEEEAAEAPAVEAPAAEASSKEELPPSPSSLPAGSGLAAIRANKESEQSAAVAPSSQAPPPAEAASATAAEAAPAPVEVPTPAPAPAVLPPATRAKMLQAGVPDPWAAIGDGTAIAKILEEAWDQVLDDPLADSGPSGGIHLEAKDAGLQKLEVSAYIEGAAISIDVSGNELERVDALPALWIRHLNLGGNQLESIDALAVLFPRLLSIDLSFVDIPSLDGGWAALAACPRLRSLSAEGAGVCSFEDMATLPNLESLELLENDVEEVAELSILAKRCPALLRLDLRENPVATEPFYLKAVKKQLPKLIWHNNQSGKKYVPCGMDKLGAIDFGADVAAIDGLYKNESCSCLEGNPCVDSITCIDWEHRELVAAEARRRKGLRGPAGEFV